MTDGAAIHIVLVHPEIPPNTGNAIRLAANTGARLHLVEPLGFSMDDRSLKRAGLDYHEYARVQVHRSWRAARDALGGRRWLAFTTQATRLYADVCYAKDDVLVFGSETAGLPEAVLAEFPEDARIRLPMRPGIRSVNLSNAVAIAVFEAWRQLGFAGGS
jgi:tRNA (cytidine/uridine-2'-O-)-methyltransferase